MGKFLLVSRVLMGVFLVICVAVHVRGLISPFSAEPVWSHVVHTVSYMLCLVCVLRMFPAGWLVYAIGAIYPVLYHGRCAWHEYSTYGRFSVICLLVVVLMPAGLALVWRINSLLTPPDLLV